MSPRARPGASGGRSIRLLSPEGKRKPRLELGQVAGKARHPAVVSIGALTVNVAPEVRMLRGKLAEMEQMRSFVTIDPRVRAGEPVVRGTRIEIRTLAELAAQGASASELLEDFPALTAESLDAARARARMYPRRGRPRRAPWKDGAVIRHGA